MSKLEYLNPEDWSLHVIDGENEAVPEGWFLVPEGAEIVIERRDGSCLFARDNGSTLDTFNTMRKDLWYTESTLGVNNMHENYTIKWQRKSKSEVVEEKLDVKKMVAQIEVDMATMGSYSHYFKDVRHLTILDVYRVLKLFEVDDPCIQHAVKKLLCGGKRGAKNVDSDIKEAIDSLVRFQEMRKEDNNG